MQITLVTTTGERFFIPTSKKKETQQAIQDAKQRFVEIHPARVIPIDDYLTQMKNRKDSLQLELDGINLQMSTIRAHYQQSRANLLFKESAWNKDHQLKQLQPTKEKLQRQILGLRTEITRVQALKKQGVKSVKMES